MTSHTNEGSSKDKRGVVHVYDDIEEMDNHLPRWWLATLFGAMVFAAVYWLDYHSLGINELPNEEHARVMQEEAERRAEELRNMGEVTDELMVTLSKDAVILKEGQETFTATCATCHGPNGEGKIGPNLTDEYWLHSNKPTEIYNIVKNGFIEKQMPAWSETLGESKVRSAAAYVLSISGKGLPGKAPQGEKMSMN